MFFSNIALTTSAQVLSKHLFQEHLMHIENGGVTDGEEKVAKNRTITPKG